MNETHKEEIERQQKVIVSATELKQNAEQLIADALSRVAELQETRKPKPGEVWKPAQDEHYLLIGSGDSLSLDDFESGFCGGDSSNWEGWEYVCHISEYYTKDQEPKFTWEEIEKAYRKSHDHMGTTQYGHKINFKVNLLRT